MDLRSFKILLPLFLLMGPLYAQQLPIRTYTSRDGLVRTDVRAICQDSSGFLWLGTSDGLSRYDGVAFTSLPLPGPPGSNFINALAAHDTTLWIATNGSGLLRLCRNTVAPFSIARDQESDPENRVNTIAVLGGSQLLAGTDRGLFLFDGTGFSRLDMEQQSPGMPVSMLFNDARGAIWAAADSALFVMKEGAERKFRRLRDFGPSRVYAMASTGRDTLWIATGTGLHCARREEERLGMLRLPRALGFLSTVSIRTLLFDGRGTLWIGTEEDGVFGYRNGRLTVCTSAHGLPSDRIATAAEDREGNLWFATGAGLCRLSSDRRFVGFPLTGRLARAYVSAITQDRSGAQWFGTPYGLSRLSNGRFINMSTEEGLSGNYVLSLLADSAGSLWVGTTEGLNRSSGAGAHPRFGNPAPDLAHHIVRSLVRESDGTLWCGWERGISALRHGRLTSYVFPDSFRSPRVIALIHAPPGTLWAGTEGDGLCRFAVGRKENGQMEIRLISRYTTADGLSDNSIRSLLLDRTRRLWVGTRFGGVDLCAPLGDSLSVTGSLRSANGLSGDWVRWLLQDSKGNIWIATNRGVDRWSPAGGLESMLQAGQQGTSGDDAYTLFEDTGGDIWIGMSNGVLRCSPSAESSSPLPPPIHIVRFQVFGRDDSSALLAGSTELAYTQHSVAFEYIAPVFSGQYRVPYRYMLEGLDSGWSAPTDRRYVNYTHLPPGDFRFRVVAQNGNGPWSAEPASFSFSIASPFWARWWFMAGAVGLVCLAILGFHRVRITHRADIERVRNRIAADLHDDIGSTLSSIAVFSRLAEQEVAGILPSAADTLQRIGASAQTILESLDDIVWMVKPGNDCLDTVMIRIREYAARICEASSIALTFSAPPNINRLRMSLEDRRQLYLIAKEAIHNVVKHSHCSHATVSLHIQGKDLTLHIVDDGLGFDQVRGQRGNGLENMQRRAKAMGGHLMIETAPQGGTSVVLRSRIT